MASQQVHRSRSSALALLMGCWLLAPTGASARPATPSGVGLGAPGDLQLAQGQQTLPEASEVEELIRQAEALDAKGDYRGAGERWERILEIREKALGPDHPDTATSLNNLADFYRAQGRYGEAEPLYMRALAIHKKSPDPENRDAAISLNNLAELYRAQGRYREAEPLYMRSTAIFEIASSLEQPDTTTGTFLATSLNNLALLYQYQGRYAEAEPLFRRARAIYEKALGSEHRFTATSLNNLAILYQDQGRFAEAEPLFKRARAIHEKALGSEHPDVAVSLNNMAELYRLQGRYGEAEPLFKRASAIYEKALGSAHPVTATSLNNLAELYRFLGRYGEAEPLLKRSLRISEKVRGPMHPGTARSLNNLALLYVTQSRSADARPLLIRLTRSQGEWLRRELPVQPREVRSRLLGQQTDSVATIFTLLDRDPAAADLALETRLNRQGLLAEIERRQRQVVTSSPQTRELAERIAGIDGQLASVSLPPERRQALQEERQRLELDLYRALPALRIEAVSTAQVAAALRTVAADGVLVEFQRYRPHRRGRQGWVELGAARYVALLLRPDGTIATVPLGDAAPIDAAVDQALTASARNDPDALQRWAQVSRLVVNPLQSHLGGIRQLFLSPDGELHRVPFTALPAPAEPSRLLGEAFQLRLLTTGRDLVQLQQPARSGSAAVLVANPTYDAPGRSSAPPRTAAAGRGGSQQRSGELGTRAWSPLPATAEEARLLAPLLKVPQPITERQATAARVLQQKGPRILHIATHGFFQPDQPPADSQGPAPTAATTAARREDPLLRSGLVLAGANHPEADPADDGYLTAAEATGMDLAGTALVTLSACETGLGDVRSGEGVYGLQRALTVAGARSTLLTLWKVDDAKTRDFMAEYYRLLQEGKGRAEALALTQAAFRANRDETYHDVYAWGAFQLTGDWRPIQGL